MGTIVDAGDVLAVRSQSDSHMFPGKPPSQTKSLLRQHLLIQATLLSVRKKDPTPFTFGRFAIPCSDLVEAGQDSASKNGLQIQDKEENMCRVMNTCQEQVSPICIMCPQWAHPQAAEELVRTIVCQELHVVDFQSVPAARDRVQRLLHMRIDGHLWISI